MTAVPSTGLPPGGRVLVTGGSGAIGAASAAALHAAGYEVSALDVAAAGPAPGIRHVPGDVRDLDLLLATLAGVDAVVHCGGLPSDRPGREDELFAVNVAGTCTLLHAAVRCGVPRLVYLSSVNALGCVGAGRPRYLPVDDDHPHHPVSPYQLSKHLAEEACRQVSAQHGLTTICLRPCYVTHPDPSPRPAGPDADGLFAYVDLRDVTDAVRAALTADLTGFHALLLAAPDLWSGGDPARTAAELHPDLPWRGSPDGGLVDCRPARRLLGWSARHRRPRTD
ncbi:NAD(P)-dependent oxidoreductase [Dactylosporangium fulvum]|uniref:NAD-dependent epimerase/dehydratase family protein n=1 Tax=Dactylosporangium fulvum TaxID=53359 RepID=A0ABY5W1Y4_9ACTN|nr:NAD-dependent epimerase/dehydratase family protein [Dactylosporangium fulvum]UWP83116.1 NAD-dependent epimerase/dehydratase family protein [Dactylosporangium fulvum]